MSLIFFFSFFFFLSTPLLSFPPIFLCSSCHDVLINNSPHVLKPSHETLKFNQRNKRFWEFDHQSNTWVEVQLPYDLVSCINGDCRVVGAIREPCANRSDNDRGRTDDGPDDLSPQRIKSTTLYGARRRISLTRMSEASVWVTGPSGSIYERFWNGLQWVIAPHDLPVTVGYAVSVFIVNQTILALSELGLLYQLRLTEESQPIWAEFKVDLDKGISEVSLGLSSDDKKRLYFCSKNGTLLELLDADPPRWANHGRPPGVSLASIADGALFKQGHVFTISGAGNLYEYDPSTKPPWKKHIHREEGVLAPAKACSLYGVFGPHSSSLFLLTKGGELVERRLQQRRWKWVVHGNPKGHQLTSITCISEDEPNDNSNALFATTASGLVFEYRMQKSPGSFQDRMAESPWLNHEHPVHAQVASGIPGLQLQPARLIFALDDGRLGELHLSGHGGEILGPNVVISARRKSLLKYVWSVLDTPETEGWNAKYCTEERGPSNCIAGTKEETLTSKWRKDRKRTQQNYLLPANVDIIDEQHDVIADEGVKKFFRLRLMQERTSFFMVTENGMMFEYLSSEDAWLWLRHEHSTRMEGVVGSYNGSLFTIDEYGSLLIRERSTTDLTWTNCTAMRKGRPVISGSPWDSIPGQVLRARPEDSIFLVSRNGRLLQFTVALRKFEWKDCRNPAGVKVASIVDQERFRENIVFVVGTNGRLYQYNKVTELWHEHHQSQHLVLSRSPGTAMRPSIESLKGSLFMISKDGGLVEYEWRSVEGWDWIEHGTPHTNVTLVGAPGPCFGGNEVFSIGLDGNVYLRYLDEGEWSWRNYGFPYDAEKTNGGEETCKEKEYADSYEHIRENQQQTDKNCDPKVSSTRPIPFSEDTVIFELQDGRLAEMRRMVDEWVWTRTIGTPTSQCTANFWTSWAS